MAESARLPKKEADLFKIVVSCYENKQYAKGIKTADNVLKKFPNHGETQSMKGLIYNCLGRKDEALELIKNGIRNDVKSHICWHVFGLYHRADSNYPEAIKCYLNALKIDINNHNILRDLSWLQIQMRDVPGFVLSRKRILELKPTQRISWVTFAVANYIGAQYQVAYEVVEKYKTSGADKAEAYEESELYLFQNKCLESQGKYDDAVAHLQRNKNSLVDKLSMKVKLAELQTLAGNFDAAVTQWEELVKDQSDNYRFHSGLQTAILGLDASTSAKMFALKRLELPSTTLDLNDEQLEKLKKRYLNNSNNNKKSTSIAKIALTLCRNNPDLLRSKLDEHMQHSLRNGMPALYHDVCSLLKVTDDSVNPPCKVYSKDASDVLQVPTTSVILELVEQYVTNLRAHGHFHAKSATTEEDIAAIKVEPPTALLWALYLQAHMYELCGRLDEALIAIDASITHTPTAIDMHAKKARILKKLGNVARAAVCMDDCRMLDLQDRYLNNKTTKYLMRADEIPLAMNTIAMFTKHEGDPQKTLYELQCNWYELEAAEAFARTKQWGAALRKFYAVKKHFSDYYDDMFDFHGYCIRKTTLRAYLDIMNMQDGAYTHPFYQRATRGALRIFLHLIDFPEDSDGLGHLSAADRKKERLRIKKLKKKAEDAKKAEEEAARIAASENGDDAADKKKENSKDIEPDEDVLLAKDFMVESAQWCGLLINRLAACEASTIALVCDSCVRRSEYSQAVEALQIGLQKYPQNPELVYSLVRLVHKVKSPGKKSLGPNANKVREDLAVLLSSASSSSSSSPPDALDLEGYLAAFINQQQQQTRLSLTHLLAYLRSRHYIDSKASATPSLVLNSTASDLLVSLALWSGKGINVQNVIETVKFLSSHYSTEAATIAFTAHAKTRYPHATYFEPDNTVSSIQASAAAAKDVGNSSSSSTNNSVATSSNNDSESH